MCAARPCCWRLTARQAWDAARDSNPKTIGGRMLFALAARDLASARIADLWAESARPDKEIEALELLRSSHPRLVGVNRRLAECYLHMDKPDLDVAIRRIEEDPPRSRSP